MARTRKPFIPAKPVMCNGKRRYSNEREAESVKSEQELLTRDLELNVYRCSLGCGGWHLTRNVKQ
jgi:hypothetical protein